jgi:hypothetical protein
MAYKTNGGDEFWYSPMLPVPVNQNVPFLPDTIPTTAMQDSLLRNGGSSGIVNGAC